MFSVPNGASPATSPSAFPGSTARLTCTLSSGFSVDICYIHWYQQKSGSPPQFLLHYYSDSNKHQGSGIPRCFSGSKDASSKAMPLLISGLQFENEADSSYLIGHNGDSHIDTGRWGHGIETSTGSESCSMAI
uniref:Immunoglobulin V-set domain-containing protein n=1 Tax=Mustela putorius furo TaxID=9669 RepID=M3YMK2_MUSPF